MISAARVFRLGPNDRRPVAFERQNGERARRQEMLHGFAVMRLRMCDGGDDAGLRIGPAHAFDAGLLAETRTLAVGGDEKPRFDLAPSCERRRQQRAAPRQSWQRYRARRSRSWFSARTASSEGAPEFGILDHESAGLARVKLGIEADEMRAEVRIERRIGDLDGDEGLRLGLERWPHPKRFEQMHGSRRKCGGARVVLAEACRIEPRPTSTSTMRKSGAISLASASESASPTKPPPAMRTSQLRRAVVLPSALIRRSPPRVSLRPRNC